jgi:hypothetical protein
MGILRDHAMPQQSRRNQIQSPQGGGTTSLREKAFFCTARARAYVSRRSAEERSPSSTRARGDKKMLSPSRPTRERRRFQLSGAGDHRDRGPHGSGHQRHGRASSFEVTPLGVA